MQDQSLVPNNITYTILIDAICKEGNLHVAMNLLNEMVVKVIVLEIITYNALINGFCEEGSFNFSFNPFVEMEKKGIMMDEVTYITLIHSLMKSRKEQEENMLSQQITERGLVPRNFTPALFVDGCKLDDVHNDFTNNK